MAWYNWEVVELFKRCVCGGGGMVIEGKDLKDGTPMSSFPL